MPDNLVAPCGIRYFLDVFNRRQFLAGAMALPGGRLRAGEQSYWAAMPDMVPAYLLGFSARRPAFDRPVHVVRKRRGQAGGRSGIRPLRETGAGRQTYRSAGVEPERRATQCPVPVSEANPEYSFHVVNPTNISGEWI